MRFANYYSFLSNLLGYSLMISNGYCRHTNGGSLTQCINTQVNSLGSCEAFCTSQTSCVGYTYRADFAYCWLIPSDSNCLSGFELQPSNVATSVNDLVGFASSEHVCYGKNAGKKFRLDQQSNKGFIYLDSISYF